MKKILTFFMAVVVATSMFALPQKGLSAKDAKASFEKAKVENPLKAKVEKKHSEKLLVRDFVPAQVKEKKALAPVKKAAAKNSVAANERDTVKVSFDEFQVGPDFYEDYEEWYVAVGNGSCGFRFDWYSADYEGTFTIDDMELEYSYGWYLDDWDEEVYVEYVEVEMTTSKKAVDEYTDLLTLDATILGDDDKVYVISATHKILKPKETIELAIETGTMTWDVDWELATLDAKNSDMEIYMEWICWWATNPVSIYDVMDYTIKYKGETLELIGLDMTVDAVKNDKGVIGYEIYMEMLSSEPIQYNVTVFAPIESTETVEIEINNLSIDASSAYDWGWIFCDGYNDEWELNAGIDAYVMGFEMAEGTYKGQNEVMFYLTNKVTGDFTEQLYAEVVVTNDPQHGWVLTFESLCTDNKTYKVTMKKEVPAATDTVAIRFDKSANAAYYPWLDNDLLLANSNEQFYAGIDVVGVEMGGEFTMEDLDLSYSLIFSDYANRVMVDMADVKGKLFQVEDTTFIKAEVMGYDGVLYDVELWHCVPTPTKTVNVEIAADFENNINTDGYYVLSGYNEANTLYISLAPFAEEVAGTFVNDGVFSRFGEGQYDFYCDYSAVYKNVNGEAVPFSVEKCTMTVTEEANGAIKAVASLIAADAVQYEVTMSTTYNNHLNYDAEEGAIDRTYTADDVLLIEQYGDGISYLEVEDADGSDLFALYFFSEEYDSEIVIQPGTYTIDDTQDYMTVLASVGVVGQSIYPSFYGYLSEDGRGIITPLYFLVGGTVEVENRNGNLYVEVNAVNSYGVPVHIVYDATPVTPVEPVEMVGVVKRAVQNGDAVIVLTHEADGTAHIYNVVEGLAYEVSQEGVIAVDPENAGDYLAISDIALTEDGKLVATNYMQTQSGDDYVNEGYKRGETRIYMWDDLAGAPSILFTSKMSSNWFRSKQGLTMAVKGTSDNMEIFMTGIHATSAWARVSSYRVINGVYEEPAVNHNDHYYFYDIADAIALETTVGTQYELNASPLGAMNWVLDAELINPTEIVESSSNNVEIATSVALTEDLGKKYNGASYVTVDGAAYVVAPFANPDGELVGVEILNITNGFDAPQYVDMVYVEEAAAVEAAATAVQVVEGGLNITLVADNAIQTWFVELSSGSEYEVYEEEITNLVIDLDNLVLIGGPSANFQVDVYLPLGEYNMSEDSYQLTAESSIAVLGQDATFIEGYAYEIDAFTPSAKAVVRCEWNGMKLEFHLTMSAAPMEATVVVVEDAVVKVEKYQIWGDMYDYALTMTGAWVNPEDGLTYPVLVEVPVYYPEATEPSEIMSTVTVGGWNDEDPWLGFGEGTLTVTTVDGVVTATGIVQNPMAGVAIDITISGKLPQDPGPGTGIEDVEVEVKAVKLIKNGQLIINRDGKEYNAQGAILK